MSEHVDRLILGTNPFSGTDHFLAERARLRKLTLDADQIRRVMESAFASGASGMNVGTDARGYQIIRALGEISSKEKIGVYALVPDTRKYVTAQLTNGTWAMVSDALEGLSMSKKVKTVIRGGLSVLTSDPAIATKAFVEAELMRIKSSLPSNAELRSVLVHEAVTDIAVALHAGNLLKTYIDAVSRNGVRPGFVTRNLVAFVDFLKQTGVPLNSVTIMTPLNPIGFQMTPSREACESVLSSIPTSSVIAMSILAGGQVPLSDAISYLKSQPNLGGIAVGVSSVSHALTTFATLRETFK